MAFFNSKKKKLIFLKTSKNIAKHAAVKAAYFAKSVNPKILKATT
jgi:hypothetical protein